MFLILYMNRLNHRVNRTDIQQMSRVCEYMCIFVGLYVANVFFYTLNAARKITCRIRLYQFIRRTTNKHEPDCAHAYFGLRFFLQYFGASEFLNAV